LHTPTLHALSSDVQSTGVPGTHVKVVRLHVSVPVHGLASSQSVSVVHPHVLGSLKQPVASKHESAVQAIPSSHVRAIPVHAPETQVSGVVQFNPSLHGDPSTFAGSLQAPVNGSQVPGSWHWSLAVQTTGFDPTHAPSWQLSVCVHAFPSSHEPATGAFTQAPVAESHESAVHTSRSSQFGVGPGTHAPAVHVSGAVHASPSVHSVPSGRG
jgi:hypothetical protein